MKEKSVFKDFIFPGVAFLLIFALLLSLFTFLYLPKWSPSQDGGQMAGFYKEPNDTLDVLFLGSCNMYTSIAPVLMYEEYGITGYAFTCPDQEMSTTYHFLKEALKTQTPKAVVVEALFFTHYNTSRRERYNRYAFDYMPLSFNKIAMAASLAERESEFMSEYDSTTPDPLLTFFGYLFPILRYHSRTDLTEEDVTFFLSDNTYNLRKGNSVRYTQPLNQDYYTDVAKVHNGDGINDIAAEYFPKIQALCAEYNIPLVVMKSPNYARWGHEDEPTRYVREYLAEQGVPFVDFHADEYDNFLPEDYSHESVLNVYGDRKLTHTIAGYLVENYNLTPTALSEEDAAAWDDCVVRYYAGAKEAGACITPGQMAYVTNRDGAACVRWNECDDCSTYALYRSLGHSEDFQQIATVSGNSYDDIDVVSGQGYSYYIVPLEGARAQQKSEVIYSIYVGMPQNYSATNDDGAIVTNWDPVDGATDYRIHRMSSGSYSYELWHTLTETTFSNSKVTDGQLYSYRLTALVEEDGEKYFSEAVYASAVAQETPFIKSVSISEAGAITLKWDALKYQDTIQIWRKSAYANEFVLYSEVDSKDTSYTNSSYLDPGVEYSYKLVSTVTNFGQTTSSAESNIVTIRVPD